VTSFRVDLADHLEISGYEWANSNCHGLLPFPLSDVRGTRAHNQIPCYTTIPGAVAAVEGIIAYREGNLTVKPLQEYFAA
jgi:hypothetical protein